jgi:uncharacterized protein YkwD
MTGTIQTLGAIALLVLCLPSCGAQEPAKLDGAFLDDPATKEKLGPVRWKILRFCFDHRGKKVGDGECTALVEHAFRFAGARRFPPYGLNGDYVWGKLVATVRPHEVPLDKIEPGDILQFRDVKFEFETKTGATETLAAPHHTAVVVAVQDRGRVLSVLEQNAGAKGVPDEKRKIVKPGFYPLPALQSGWIKAYRPVALPPRPVATAAENDPRVVEILRLLNRERTAQGLKPLKMNPLVSSATAALAKRVAGGQKVEGSELRTFLDETGYWDTRIGWLDCTGTTSPKEVAQTWLASKGARAQILDARFTDAGIILLADRPQPLCCMMLAASE